MLIAKLTCRSDPQAAHQAGTQLISQWIHQLGPNLTTKLMNLPPKALSAELAPLSAPQLASIIFILLSHQPDFYSVFPENRRVVSSFITKLASKVSEGSFSPVASELASLLSLQVDPKGANKLSSGEICQVAYNLASLLGYQSIYQSTLYTIKLPTIPTTFSPVTSSTTSLAGYR
jgi:hypothetical protein